MKKSGRNKLGGAVYILPNLITTGNLFCGFFSIIKSVQGQPQVAATAILLAAIFDILDGRVARLTGGTSEFGVQYDSLCDLVSFGMAPAFLMYQTGLEDFGRVGWIASFIFLACGALRLARFNVQSSIGKASGDFTGLPIPMAAGFIASFAVALIDLQVLQTDQSVWKFFQSWFGNGGDGYFMLGAAPILGVLMVSNVSFRSHKSLKINGLNPFKFLVIGVVVIGLVAIHPEFLGFLFFFCYAISGPVESVFSGRKALDDDDIFGSGYDEQEADRDT